MASIILGLGANLGDREANLVRAIHRLRPFVNIDAVSSLYESEPVGYRDQPWFFNAVCRGHTELDPPALLRELKKIEREQGREEGPRFGPRPIDLDILFYDEQVIDTPSLQIPHPRLAERAFVLVPLAEIAPRLVHPAIGCTVAQMLASLPRHEDVRLVKRRWVEDETSGGGQDHEL